MTDLALATASHSLTSPPGSAPAAGMAGERVAPAAAEVAPHRALAAAAAVMCAQLRNGWSPASIAGRLPREYAADESCWLSHEAIYRWLHAQPVSTLAKELIRLRTGRTVADQALSVARRLDFVGTGTVPPRPPS